MTRRGKKYKASNTLYFVVFESDFLFKMSNHVGFFRNLSSSLQGLFQVIIILLTTKVLLLLTKSSDSSIMGFWLNSFLHTSELQMHFF